MVTQLCFNSDLKLVHFSLVGLKNFKFHNLKSKNQELRLSLGLGLRKELGLDLWY